MRTMMAGFTGWMKFEQERTQAIRTVDAALTVVGTLVLAATWALLHSAH